MTPPPDESPPFTVIVSEKGGAERRQSFGVSELNVGRVQGNELMLPKGNVSKRHARLLFRDGRFIVTDLNSTNGTYVNRRRIAQATIVREGDRIYIGDFVLRIELNPVDAFDEKTGSSSRPSFTSVPDRSSVPDSVPREQVEESPSAPSYSDELTQAPVPRANRADSDGPTPNLAMQERTAGVLRPTEGEAEPRDSGISAARQRSVVQAIVSQVLAEVGEEQLLGADSEELTERVQRLATEKASKVLLGHEPPDDLTADEVAARAVAELTDLGPLAALLADATVTQIAVPRYDQLTVTRGNRLAQPVPTFSCDWSVNAALVRLAKRAGLDLHAAGALVEFVLADGTRVSGVRGDAAPTGTLLVIHRPRRVSSTLEKLVRRGAISRAMATFLAQCVTARLNLLIVGPRDEGALMLLSALASASGSEPLVALSGSDDVVAHTDAATRLNVAGAGTDATRLMQIAAQIPEARLVATLSDARVAAAAIEAIGAGIDGVLASFRAPDIRRAVQRLAADLTLARPGLGLQAAREWLKSSFDLVLEVARLKDGRVRVLRVAEFSEGGPEGLQLTDIFRFVVERTASGGDIEGSFMAAERPGVAERIEAAGIELESSLFSRSQSSH